jgi:hypothetical protein
MSSSTGCVLPCFRGVLFDEVKDALTVEECAAAAKSLLNAHYTGRESSIRFGKEWSV